MISKVGLMLYGYCNGFFGRSSYEPKRVEALGIDWVVVRNEKGQLRFASFESTKAMNKFLNLWHKP